MEEHLTAKIVDSLRTRNTPPDQLIAIDDHLTSCAACREMIGASFATTGAAARLEQVLTGPGHLQYEAIEAYVDGRLSADERAGVTRHVESCPDCAVQLRELQEFAAVPHAVEPVASPSLLASLASFFARPVPILVSVAALLLIGVVVWQVVPDNDIGVAPDSVETTPRQPAVVPTEPLLVDKVPVKADEPKEDLAIAINDGGERIGISRSGELSGYGSVRSNYRRLVRSALATGRLTHPDLGELKAPAGALMGDGSSEAGSLRVNSPVGKSLDSDNVTFRWQPVENAESYVVEVFDRSYNKVASSGELKNASWKYRLPRGQIFTWQVTAVSDGKVFKAPQRPQPEARFRILDKRMSEELASLRRTHPRSHLLLGTAYANAGLIDEAIREFEMLDRQDPGQDLTKRYLRQLRSLR